MEYEFVNVDTIYESQPARACERHGTGTREYESWNLTLTGYN